MQLPITNLLFAAILLVASAAIVINRMIAKQLFQEGVPISDVAAAHSHQLSEKAEQDVNFSVFMEQEQLNKIDKWCILFVILWVLGALGLAIANYPQ